MVPSPPDGNVSVARTFVDLDDRLLATDARSAHGLTVLVVRAPLDAHAAIVAHAARRMRAGGWLPLDAFGRNGSNGTMPLWCEVGAQLGIATGSQPQSAALAVSSAFGARSNGQGAILAALPDAGTWDSLVLAELVRAGRPGLIVLVTSSRSAATREANLDLYVGVAGSNVPLVYEFGGELCATSKQRWLEAVAEEAKAELALQTLPALEAWWRTASRTVASEGVSADTLSVPALALLRCLVLASRSLPVASLGADADASINELVTAALVVRRGALVSLASTARSAVEWLAFCQPTRDDEQATAFLLAGAPGFEPDPWCQARAAELHLKAGDPLTADALIAIALRRVDDEVAFGEMANRWFHVVAPTVGEEGRFLRVQAARRALGVGDAHDALRWCESAATRMSEDAGLALLMGRALMQLGDLVAARVALHKASRMAKGDEARASVAAELAELNYLAGTLDLAVEQASQAIALSDTVSTRLHGRNTLGKVLLSKSSWDAADTHFAEDVLTAATSGDTVWELRARLNRGIALMSKGPLDEARAMLARVLEDGTIAGEERACAYALANLGVVAFRQRDYAAALDSWERASRYRPTLRGRLAVARTLTNLAELRLRLGLIEHAEQALAFGRRLITGTALSKQNSHFLVVAARIALARHDDARARREIDAALMECERAGDQAFLGEVFEVAARVALEEGDLTRAAEAIERAESLATQDCERAEVALVRALHLRATGQSPLDAATAALTLAGTAGEEDLLSEIYALLAVVHRDRSDNVTAHRYAARAVALRDQIASGLPGDIRAAFLAKSENVALSRLVASLGTASLAHDRALEALEEEAPRTERPSMLRVTRDDTRELIGDDIQIRNLLAAIPKVARSNSIVLIRGESGTGKELVAEALHKASDRARGPLVTVNCAALVETLLLSELFGHEKGAFTGASARRRGRFEVAEGGTLFLDEIGDISPRTQVALLRVLQEKTFERVGGAQAIRADVHVICATHRDLKAMVDRGEFREDLYYRLKGITLEVPPLRSRLGDIPKIATHLLRRIGAERGREPSVLAPDAVALLQRHRWPGNVRELENVLRAVSLFAESDQIRSSDLIDHVDEFRMLAQSGPPSQPPISLRSSLLPPPPPSFSALSLGQDGDDVDESGALPDGEANATAVAYAQVRQGAVSLSAVKRQIERDCIARALGETKGNITRAASLLGMKRPRLSQLVKQYGLATSLEALP